MKNLVKISSPLIFLFSIIVLSSPIAIPTEAQPLINEFMASNTSTITDKDGDYPDWIELYNTSDTAIDLTGYGLSDRPDNPYKWVFPNCILSLLNPNQHMLVYTSGKDRTNVPNHWETVIQQGNEWRYFIGVSEPPKNWHSVEFDDSVWQSGSSGIGSRDDDATVISQTRSLYIRKTFNIDDITNITHFLLQIDYDDAFVAYINGIEIARDNIGEVGTPPLYNTLASGVREMQMYAGGKPEAYQVDNIRSFIQQGENVLAIQIHNFLPFNSDISVIPFLTFGMIVPPMNPKGVPDILKFSIPTFFYHTNFKISTEGETLVLTDNYGVLCDSVYTKIVGFDVSMGRKPDGGTEWVLFLEPTPGESNITDGFKGNDDLVIEVSHPGGFYDNGISVELSVNSQTAEIKYTLDGSEPSDSSEVYSAPVYIDSTTVLRARAFEAGLFPGRISTNTYFINENTALPVISISTNPENLWDADIGIYVKGNSTTRGGYPVNPTGTGNYCEDWERPIHIEFYEPDGSVGFSIDAGVKIVGKGGRQYPRKSLAIFARAKYGYSEMNHQIFPNLPITEFKNFVLRNGGTEQIMNTGTLLRCGLHQTLMSPLDLEVQAYRPAVVFLNGAYWGIHNIREKLNEDYLASHHGVDPDRVDILDDYHAVFVESGILQEYQEGATSWTCFVVEGNPDHYHALLRYMLDNDESDSTVYAYLKTQIDIENFIDYMVSRIYISDPDGPGHNTKFWRPQTPNGKWRWLMYDTEWGFGVTQNPFGVPGPAYLSNFLDYYKRRSQQNRGRDVNFMLYNLSKNNSFKNDFVNRYADYLNTIYSTEQVIPQIMALKSAIEPEMPRHLARWSKEFNEYTASSKSWDAIDTVEEWYNNIDKIIEFAEKRPYYTRLNVVSEFDLSGTADVTLDVSQSATGEIKINTLTIEEYPWSGTYFQDIPVKLNALPAPGYTFTGWTGVEDTDSQSITVTLTKDTLVTANFEEDTTAINTIVINEINYNSANNFDPEDWVELYNAYDIPVDISGWVFKDEDNANSFVIPENSVIAAGDYFVLCRDESLFHTSFPEVDNYIGSFNFGLNNAGELIRLFNTQGDIVDSLTYDDAAPWPVEPDGSGPTLELQSPDTDNTVPENWVASSANGTPGVSNDIDSGVDEETDVPIAFSLGQNYPNPFNSVTTIPFSIPISGRVTIEIYSILGQRVVKILDENMTSGQYNVVFKADNLASGLYIYTIKAQEFNETRQMVLMK